MSNRDIEGHVPPESAAKAANPPSGAPDSLERQLAKEREARQLIRDRLRHTEALAAESHALRAQMAEELERVTADRDRLRAEATVAAAIATEEPAAARATSRATATGAAERPRPAPGRQGVRGAEPTMSPPLPPAPRPRAPAEHLSGEHLRGEHLRGEHLPGEPPGGEPPLGEHPLGERPPRPPARRGPWRALAMLGGLAAAGAGLAWLTGTMPSGLDLAASPAASTAPAAVAMRAASDASTVAARRAASVVPSAAATPPQRGAVPLPPLTPESRLAAAPTAAGPTLAAASAAAAPPAASPAPPPTAARAQPPMQAAGGLDARLRKALDAEGITAIVEVDPTSGRVLVADPQADRPLRDRTDMLIRAVYAGASLPEPQIEHRWMSPMHGERQDALQGQSAPPPNAPPRTLARAQPHEAIQAAPPAAGLATKHAEPLRAGEQRRAGLGMTMIDAEELRPVLPSGRLTAGCMEDIAGKTSNRRAALSACMKHSCCSSSASLNSEECRAYQKAYPYTCGGG